MSFKDARDALVLCHDKRMTDDGEFCLSLYDANPSQNPEFPYKEYGKFDFEEWTTVQSGVSFPDSERRHPCAGRSPRIQETVACSQGSLSDVIEGLCTGLRGFSYPCRYSDLIPHFSQPFPGMSITCSTVVDFIYNLLVVSNYFTHLASEKSSVIASKQW